MAPFWYVAGFALGAGSALMGPRAAMACTAAVEEVIEEHYASQVEQLGDDEAELRQTLEEFRAEEAAHKEIGLAHEAEQAPGYEPLSAAIKRGTRLAIWLSERI
jgi:ubiquinone biosynthesis monooxygenase Coq7